MCYSHFLSLFSLSPAPPCAGLSSVGGSASRLPGPEEAKTTEAFAAFHQVSLQPEIIIVIFFFSSVFWWSGGGVVISGIEQYCSIA